MDVDDLGLYIVAGAVIRIAFMAVICTYELGSMTIDELFSSVVATQKAIISHENFEINTFGEK